MVSEEERKRYIQFILKDLKGLNYNDDFVGLLEETFDLYEKQKQELELNKGLYGLLQKEIEKNTRLTQDNLDLDRLYRKTAVKLKENGKEELADYFLAQIGAIPTWTDFEDYKNWIHREKIEDTIKIVRDSNVTTEDPITAKAYAIQVLEDLLRRF